MIVSTPEAPEFSETTRFGAVNYPRPDVAHAVITAFHPDATDLTPWFDGEARLFGWTYRTDGAGGPWAYLGFDGLLPLRDYDDEEAAIHGLMTRLPNHDAGATRHYPARCAYCAWHRTSFEEGGPEAPGRRAPDVVAQWKDHDRRAGLRAVPASAGDLIALNAARFGESDGEEG